MQYHRWRSSAHLTALHSIAAVALSNALMMCPGNDDLRNVCSGLVTHFSVVIPERLPGFCAPSLSLLARHYIDAVEYVQQSARSHGGHAAAHERRGTTADHPRVGAARAPSFEQRRGGTAARPCVAAGRFGESALPAQELAACAPFLGPTHALRARRSWCLPCLRRASPPRLTPTCAKLLCAPCSRCSITPAELHRASAAELLGTGYPAWRAHLSPPALIRALFRLSVLHARDTAETRAPRGFRSG